MLLDRFLSLGPQGEELDKGPYARATPVVLLATQIVAHLGRNFDCLFFDSAKGAWYGEWKGCKTGLSGVGWRWVLQRKR